MKIFLDTADREAIKQWLPTGLIDGITTNPTLLSKQGSDVKKILTDICLLVPGDVSIEVVEKSPQAVYQQAKEIASLAKNVVVKIPFAQEYLPVIHTLVQEGISLNITLVFSVLQALLVSKLEVKYISPFVGRWDDIDSDGTALIKELVNLKRVHAFSSMILAASIRGLMHWHHAALLGADIITLPPEILAKAMHHPLTEQGIARFDADWKSLGKAHLLT